MTIFSKSYICAVFNGFLMACAILFATALYLQATQRMVVNMAGISSVEFKQEMQTAETVMQPVGRQ